MPVAQTYTKCNRLTVPASLNKQGSSYYNHRLKYVHFSLPYNYHQFCSYCPPSRRFGTMNLNSCFRGCFAVNSESSFIYHFVADISDPADLCRIIIGLVLDVCWWLAADGYIPPG